MSSASPGAAVRAGSAGDGDGGRGGGRERLDEVGEVGAERVVGLAGDVALEAADDLLLGLALGDAPLGVGACAGAVAQAADGDHVQGAVGVAVAAVVEAVAVAAAGGDRDRAGAAEGGERSVTAQPFDVLPGGDEQLPGVAGGDR